MAGASTCDVARARASWWWSVGRSVAHHLDGPTTKYERDRAKTRGAAKTRESDGDGETTTRTRERTQSDRRERNERQRTTKNDARAMMRTSDILLKVLAPLLGSILAQVMFMSPLPKIRSLKKAQEYEVGIGELNPLPYPFAAANCVSWLMYGAISGNYWVYVPNATGFLITLYFTGTVYGLDARWRDRMERLVGALASLLLVLGMVISCVLRNYSEGLKKTVTGSVCNAILVVYYAAPLSTVAQVVRTRDSKSFYLPLTIMNGVNGLCWFAYGLALNDWFIAAPNLLGAVLSALQLVLIFMYPSSERLKKEKLTPTTSTASTDGLVKPSP